jgi:hypothetical protein
VNRVQIIFALSAAAFTTTVVIAVVENHRRGKRERDRGDDDRFPPMSRNARVIERSGAPPIPATVTSCVLEVWSREEEDMCQAWVTCEGQRIYGSKTSYTKCWSTSAGPTELKDTNPTPKDGDARINANMSAGTMSMSDDRADGSSYILRFRLE